MVFFSYRSLNFETNSIDQSFLVQFLGFMVSIKIPSPQIFFNLPILKFRFLLFKKGFCICSIYGMISGTSHMSMWKKGRSCAWPRSAASYFSHSILSVHHLVLASAPDPWSQSLLVWMASWNPLSGAMDLSLVQHSLLSECIKGPVLNRTASGTK